MSTTKTTWAKRKKLVTVFVAAGMLTSYAVNMNVMSVNAETKAEYFESNKATITGNDFTIVCGTELTESMMIEKSGVKAYDQDGNEETVCVKFSTVDSTVPGNYRVLFESESGLPDIVTVVVIQGTEAQLFGHDFTVEYGTELTESAIVEQSEAKAYDQAGNKEAVTVKEHSIDCFTPGDYPVVLESASGVLKEIRLTVKKSTCAVIQATDFSINYNEQVHSADMIERANAKAYDQEGNPEAVEMKSNTIDVTTPGVYRVLFESESGVRTIVEASVLNAVEPVIQATDFSIEYDEQLTEADIFARSGVRAYDSDGNQEKVQMKSNTIDATAPGVYPVLFESNSGASVSISVTVKKPTEALIKSNDFDVQLGEQLTEQEIIARADAKAFDSNGDQEAVHVKFSTVDSNTPGEYRILFESESNLLAIVSVTVK